MLARRAVLGALAAALACAARPAAALPDPAMPGLRRRYLDAATGQLHLREARPARPSRAPPLVLLHQSPLSGRMYERLLPRLARGRVALAVDTPGYGESDRPPVRPPLPAYGDAILDAVTREYAAPVDLLGYHTGAAIAAELAARRPRDVRRLVLVAVPFFDAPRRAELLGRLGPAATYAEDGSHLLPLWTGSFRARAPGQGFDDVARLVAEKQRPGPHGDWALAAAMELDLGPLLGTIASPTLVLAPHDGLEDESRAAAAAIRGARLVELPGHAYGLFDGAPDEVAGHVAAFLDAADGQ